MPDLDRTTLLKAIDTLTHLRHFRRGLKSQAISECVRELEALLPAPSEAPAEAFTAQFSAEEIDEAAARLGRKFAGVENPSFVAMLTDYARLVRERHTGKG